MTSCVGSIEIRGRREKLHHDAANRFVARRPVSPSARPPVSAVAITQAGGYCSSCRRVWDQITFFSGVHARNTECRDNKVKGANCEISHWTSRSVSDSAAGLLGCYLDRHRDLQWPCGGGRGGRGGEEEGRPINFVHIQPVSTLGWQHVSSVT